MTTNVEPIAAPIAREAASPAEVARMLGVSIATVYRRLDDGMLPSILFGGRRLIPLARVREMLTKAGGLNT